VPRPAPLLSRIGARYASHMANTAADPYDRDELLWLRELQASLASHIGPGPTTIIPISENQPEAPHLMDNKAGESDADGLAATSGAGPDVAAVTDDLLHGIKNPGPAVVALARQAAESTHWVWNWTDTMGKSSTRPTEPAAARAPSR
jgi:hypothetical protein